MKREIWTSFLGVLAAAAAALLCAMIDHLPKED